jgi:hypothetical protein
VQLAEIDLRFSIIDSALVHGRVLSARERNDDELGAGNAKSELR